MDYNPFLAGGQVPQGRGAVEQPQNLAWQTRAAPPTEFENRLADALEQAFGAGAETLAEVVARLNQMEVLDAAGARWTEASFQALLQRLGA